VAQRCRAEQTEQLGCHVAERRAPATMGGIGLDLGQDPCLGQLAERDLGSPVRHLQLVFDLSGGEHEEPQQHFEHTPRRRISPQPPRPVPR
jgi:hypothetical protein